MKITRVQRWGLSIVVFVQLLTTRCEAASSSDTLSASKNLYVVNTSDSHRAQVVVGDSSPQDDSGSCEGIRINLGDSPSVSNTSSSTNITNGSDSSTGVTPSPTSSSTPSVDLISSSTDASASIDAIDSNSTHTVDSSSSSTDTSASIDANDSSSTFTVESSSSGTDANIDTTDSSSTPTVDSSSSSTDAIDDSSSSSTDASPSIDATPTVDPISSSTDASINSTDSISPATVDPSSSSTDANSDATISINSSVISASSSSAELDSVVTLSPESESQAENEDNVIADVAGTVEPAQTNADITTDQNIIRPSDTGSASQLGTNNGSSSRSRWSSKQMTVVISTLCGIAAVAAVAVFVAVRNDQARKRKALGTPVDYFTDNDSSLATPMTHRLDGKYHHGSRGGPGDKTPLASIVVIGPDDDFHTPSGYTHQYRSYSGRSLSIVSRSSKISQLNKLAASAATIPQLDISNGPSMSDLSATGGHPIYDSNNTQVSFSSSKTSEYDAPQEEAESEDSLTDSFRVVSATYIDLNASVYHDANEATDDDISSTEVSFDSSLSSLDSSQSATRNTEASEHMHDSEDGILNSNSSRVAMSFDVGSNSPEL